MLSAMAIFAAFRGRRPHRSARFDDGDVVSAASSNALVGPTTPPPTMTVFIRSPPLVPRIGDFVTWPEPTSPKFQSV